MDKDGSKEALSLFRKATRSEGVYRLGSPTLPRDAVSAANKSRRERAKAQKAEEEADRIHRENELRTLVGKKSLHFVSQQLWFCNILMLLYCAASLYFSRTIPTEVILGWIAACLVEIIGILWVIARSLFPFRDKNRDSNAENGRHSKRGKK